MAFQNAQEPTEEPWGPNITEEEIDDEAARGGVDLDATEEEVDDNANKKGGEVVRQYLRSPVNPVVREHLRRTIYGAEKENEKKKKKKEEMYCLKDLKLKDWLHQNANSFPARSSEDTLAFIRKKLSLPSETSADEIEYRFYKTPLLLRAVLHPVDCYATQKKQYDESDAALELAYSVWKFPWKKMKNWFNTAAQ
ncbi:uncharacterized protein G6M90_00g100690 [Metarhizium brunneum]|uniref:Uncharacterized protein n=1 Tax=Metarhizium brunneum TaxID=500148 RepID=A0A7D5V3F9_9HYPO